MGKLTAEQIAAQQAEWERKATKCKHRFIKNSDVNYSCVLTEYYGHTGQRFKFCTAENCPVLNRNDNEKDGE